MTVLQICVAWDACVSDLRSTAVSLLRHISLRIGVLLQLITPPLFGSYNNTITCWSRSSLNRHAIIPALDLLPTIFQEYTQSFPTTDCVLLHIQCTCGSSTGAAWLINTLILSKYNGSFFLHKCWRNHLTRAGTRSPLGLRARSPNGDTQHTKQCCRQAK